jgi:hypothetical protein
MNDDRNQPGKVFQTGILAGRQKGPAGRRFHPAGNVTYSLHHVFGLMN